MTEVKICGLKDPDHLRVAYECGARYAGLVFVRESPRFIEPELARLVARTAPTGLRMTGLFRNADDDWISHVFGAVPLDIIQLHGNESPVRVAEIKSRFHLPVIKAFPVAVADDLKAVEPFLPVIDWILFDAKSSTHPHLNPPPSRERKDVDRGCFGGSGQVFDWTLLKNKKFAKPWMLSGGLTNENVGEALSLLSPDAVDVSSGVECARGVKDPSKIRDFIRTIKQHGA